MKKRILYLLAVLTLTASLPLTLFGCDTPEETSSATESIGESTEQSSQDTESQVSQEEEIQMPIIKNDPAYANVTLGKSYANSVLYPSDSDASYPD